jgi:hypothetical protein
LSTRDGREMGERWEREIKGGREEEERGTHAALPEFE